jgi:hypothetical protein
MNPNPLVAALRSNTFPRGTGRAAAYGNIQNLGGDATGVMGPAPERMPTDHPSPEATAPTSPIPLQPTQPQQPQPMGLRAQINQAMGPRR